MNWAKAFVRLLVIVYTPCYLFLAEPVSANTAVGGAILRGVEALPAALFCALFATVLARRASLPWQLAFLLTAFALLAFGRLHAS